MFEDVLKSIIPLPKGDYNYSLEAEWTAKDGHSCASHYYWEKVGVIPIRSLYGETYVKVHCEEHAQDEFVPRENYWPGLLSEWYKIGLHPRWPIWNTLLEYWPRCTKPPRNLFWRIGEDAGRKILSEHRDDPKGFAEQIYHLWWYEYENVPYKSNGTVFRVPRNFRDKAKASAFTPDDFLNTNNQTLRQLILRTQSFDVSEILHEFKMISFDMEGEVYSTWTGTEHYLHVKDSSTDESFLLSIPAFACKCGFATDSTWARDQHLHTMYNLTLSPALARRWTLRLPFDAEIIYET